MEGWISIKRKLYLQNIANAEVVDDDLLSEAIEFDLDSFVNILLDILMKHFK